MKTCSESLPLRCRKSRPAKHGNDRLKVDPPQRPTREIQLIYAHFAHPVIFSMTEYVGYASTPGGEPDNSSSSLRRNTTWSPLFIERKPGARQTSLAGVRKRTQL